MAEKIIDFAAAGRVASRTELRDIRVVEIAATCDPLPKGVLEPTLDVDCLVSNRSDVELQIACSYRFSAGIGESPVVNASIKYLLIYDIKGNEALAESDLAEFAIGNGTLHSWPFVRELLHGLTSKMGYPPYTLPVFHFRPKPPAKKEVPAKSSRSSEAGKVKSST